MRRSRCAGLNLAEADAEPSEVLEACVPLELETRKPTGQRHLIREVAEHRMMATEM